MKVSPSAGGGGSICAQAASPDPGRPDPATAAHMQRTGTAAGALAAILGLRPERVARLRAAAALHDVGKAAIPPRILQKPAALTPSERAEVERHTVIGHHLLLASRRPGSLTAARIALTHHERFDGSGYPLGLAGGQIPLAARIVAVADVLDALLSERPYRPALPRPAALEILAAGAGSHFDPTVVGPALTHTDALLAA